MASKTTLEALPQFIDHFCALYPHISKEKRNNRDNEQISTLLLQSKEILEQVKTVSKEACKVPKEYLQKLKASSFDGGLLRALEQLRDFTVQLQKKDPPEGVDVDAIHTLAVQAIQNLSKIKKERAQFFQRNVLDLTLTLQEQKNRLNQLKKDFYEDILFVHDEEPLKTAIEGSVFQQEYIAQTEKMLEQAKTWKLQFQNESAQKHFAADHFYNAFSKFQEEFVELSYTVDIKKAEYSLSISTVKALVLFKKIQEIAAIVQDLEENLLKTIIHTNKIESVVKNLKNEAKKAKDIEELSQTAIVMLFTLERFMQVASKYQKKRLEEELGAILYSFNSVFFNRLSSIIQEIHQEARTLLRTNAKETLDILKKQKQYLETHLQHMKGLTEELTTCPLIEAKNLLQLISRIPQTLESAILTLERKISEKTAQKPPEDKPEKSTLETSITVEVLQTSPVQLPSSPIGKLASILLSQALGVPRPVPLAMRVVDTALTWLPTFAFQALNVYLHNGFSLRMLVWSWAPIGGSHILKSGILSSLPERFQKKKTLPVQEDRPLVFAMKIGSTLPLLQKKKIAPLFQENSASSSSLQQNTTTAIALTVEKERAKETAHTIKIAFMHLGLMTSLSLVQKFYPITIPYKHGFNE